MKIKMKSSIKKISALLTMMAVAILAFTFTGCSDEATPESDDKILKPVAENVIGKWSMKESYK